MASDEARVRTMCGWIGVEISRSRVRTPGRPGYGLYRVRGSVGRAWIETRELPRSAVTKDLHGERGPWTAYAFTLEQIEQAVQGVISRGEPYRPPSLKLAPSTEWSPGALEPLAEDPTVIVPTRWTQQYRGRRDLGIRPEGVEWLDDDEFDGACVDTRCRISRRHHHTEPVPVRVRQEFTDELNALAALVGEGLVTMRHVSDGMCGCRGMESLTVACVRLTMGDAREDKRETVRTRQREANAQFQREHMQRRAVGLERRHEAKLSRSKRSEDG